VGVEPRFIESTLQPPGRSDGVPSRQPMVVLAHHAVLARVGESLALGRVTEISRLAPSLVGEDGRDAGPIDDPFVSRQPIAVRRLDDGGVEIANPGVDVAVGGATLPAGGVHRIAAGELARGVPIVLAGRVVLWLTTDHDRRGAGELGLLGCSAAIHALRAAVRDAAVLRGPILVRGETGTGKELVARALHAAGPRSAGPYVGVNVAAIPAAVAAAELFGHARGAFTGAHDRRAGYFERAHGGVVFLDEIGELPEAIQPVVLRALESGEIQPVGGEPRVVDAVVVAATDVDLEAAVRAGRFRGPLYHRLASAVIDVPPLRERGADVALLLARFLRDALPAELADRTADPSPWLPAALVAALIRAPWPGNVRQLRNTAQRLAQIARAGRIATLDQLGLGIDGLDRAEADAGGEDDAAGASGGGAQPGARSEIERSETEGGDPDGSAGGAGGSAPRGIDDDRLVAALRAHGFQLSRTAAALGVSRSHLDALIARSPRVRKANQLPRDEIAACLAELGGDVDAAAARLEVSPRGLRLRIKQLGL
jgi:two-component system, NtrC family, nitrogen regulation response regulator GlnG